jgi:hypothetical protein
LRTMPRNLDVGESSSLPPMISGLCVVTFM